jgi:hypothetical protein
LCRAQRAHAARKKKKLQSYLNAELFLQSYYLNFFLAEVSQFCFGRGISIFIFLQSYLNAHTLLARKKALVDIECALESGRGMLLF